MRRQRRAVVLGLVLVGLVGCAPSAPPTPAEVFELEVQRCEARYEVCSVRGLIRESPNMLVQCKRKLKTCYEAVGQRN